MLIGIFIGVLIGVITSIVTLVLLRTALSASITNASAVVAITSELLAIPTFWFGGPWLTTTVLELVALQEMINSYIITLGITYVIILTYPMFRWVVQLGNNLGESE